jgi:hypothetical protein
MLSGSLLHTAASTSQQFTAENPRFPNAMRVPFGSFKNKYAGGSCYVIGRGPTTFDYDNLADVAEPIFFINDAVCLEEYARSETFFFAHDAQMRVWLNGSLKSTAVLPIDGSVLRDAPELVLRHAGPVVYYGLGKTTTELLQLSRDELADRQELFQLCGTIHSLLHFVWFCGFRRVMFIGCDGINLRARTTRAGASADGYDRRLQNRSNTASWWQYSRIRIVQDLLITLFGFEAVYLGTPKC